MVPVAEEQGQTWPEPEHELFNALRRKLIFYFEAKRVGDPVELADEVLTRLARKMSESLEVSDITGYAYGVVRNVFREQFRKQKLVVPFSALTDAESDKITNLPDERMNLEPLLEEEESRRIRESSLHEALAELEDEDRMLLLEYYNYDSTDRRNVLAERKRLADRLGIGPMHLRVRIYRLRARMKKLLEEKISQKAGGGWSG